MVTCRVKPKLCQTAKNVMDPLPLKKKKVTTFKMLQKLTLHNHMVSTVIQLVNVKSTPVN